MLTSEAIDRYVTSAAAVRALATTALANLWAEMPDDPTVVSQELVTALPNLVQIYGDVVATVAADFYDEVAGSITATTVLAAPAPAQQVASSTRWALTPIFSDNPDRRAALGRLEQVVDRLIINQGHDTVYETGVQDARQPRFARVPVGETCAWCRLLASRGAVYRTQASGQFRRSHDKCDCKVAPVFDGDDLPYDRQALLDEYEAARQEAGSSSVSAITSVMRAGSPAN